MDLAGQWRAAPANDELRRVFFADDLDEVGWVDVCLLYTSDAADE